MQRLLKSTQARIALLVGVLALTAAINAVIGIINAAAVQQQLVEIERNTDLLAQHADARTNVLKQQIAVKDAAFDEKALDKAYELFYQNRDQLDTYVYQQEMAFDDPLIQKQRASTDQLGQEIDAIFQKMGDPAAAASLSSDLDKIDAQAATVEEQIGEAKNIDTNNLKIQINDIKQSVQTNLLIGQVALLILAALVIGGVYISMHITAPIDNLTSAIVAFENKTYTPDLLEQDMKRPDELGQLSRAVGNMAQSISESNQLKEQFIEAAQRFIPEQYLEFLEKDSITKVSLGDHVSAEMAVMFSDIRGFTTMSERMTAQENFNFINEYLKLVSPIIEKHEGFIVKFLGDGMMAIFPYGVEDAVQAGIEKAQMVQQFNQQLLARGLGTITVGIGIHTGPMMVGMVGEEMRMQGDAFSDNVNLTSRIEGLNKFYGTSMIISEDTLRQLPQPVTFKMRYLGKAMVKGRTTPLGMYEVYQGQSSEEIAIKESTSQDFERALDLYTRGCFAEAGQVFSQVLEKNPKDKTAQYYLEICAEHAGKPAPAGWDGTVVMDAK